MSTPSKKMRPPSMDSAPAIWPTRVVLPAPVGPTTACPSPFATSSVTSSVATPPPKRFATARSSSMLLEQAREALRRDQHDGEQHHADGEAGVVLVVGRQLGEPVDAVVRDQVLEAEQHRRADHA